MRLPSTFVGRVSGLLLLLVSSLHAQTPISGSIADGSGGPLLSGTVYHVNSGLTVPLGQTLTIQPGVILKFSLGVDMTVNGHLEADAATGSAIVFTEIADDTAGGDTNGDGPSTGVVSKWRGIVVSNGASANFNNVQLRFTGQLGRAAIDLKNNSIASITNSLFSDYGGGGLNLNIAALPMVSGCSFTTGDRPIRDCPINALPGLSNNVASGNSVNNCVNLSNANVAGNLVVDPNSMMGGAHVITTSSLAVGVGTTLTVNAGVIFKFSLLGAQVGVQGVLITNGSLGSEVVFTVYEDDDHGGDTNQDGPSQGTPGTWRGLAFSAADPGGSLTHTVVRFCGQVGDPGIGLGATAMSLDHVTSTDHTSAGVQLFGSDKFVSIQDCVFDRTLLPIDGARWFHLESFSGNTAANCSGLSAIRIAGFSIDTNVTISRSNLIGDVIVLPGPSGVAPSGHLTFNDGVILKFVALGTNLVIQGGLDCNGTAGSEVVFTSILDDSHGGDTNLDGAATTPTPGLIAGLNYSSGATGSLTSVRVRFSGHTNNAGVTTAADISMTNCTVEDCTAAGLDLKSFSTGSSVSGCAFNNCSIAIDRVHLKAFAGLSGNTASGCTLRNCIRSLGGTVLSNMTLDKSQLINGVVDIDGNLSVAMGFSLTINEGITIKFSNAFAAMTIVGELDCLGTASEPVVFTVIADDDHAGDTNEDGTSQGAPGAWQGIYFNPDSLASELDHCVIRYSGFGNAPGMRIDVANISLTNSTISDCSAAALTLNGTAARPVIRNCAFNGCAYSIRGARWGSFENIRDNTASGNSVFDSPFIETSIVSFDATLPARGMIGGCYVTSAGAASVAAATLDIERGVVVKVIGPEQMSNGQGRLRLLGTGTEPIVFTTIEDDEYAGDTNKDGPSSGSPGSWRGFIIAGPMPMTFEYALIRYTGQLSEPAVYVDAPTSEIRSLRVEHASAGGFDLRFLAAPADNLVAFECQGIGIDMPVTNSMIDLRYPTVVGCGTGIKVLPSFFGRVDGAIAWGNNTNFSGLTATQLFESNGDAGLAGVNGNLSIDPLFVDASPSVGDLGLQINSPCIDAANFGLGMTVAADHRESSRLNDHDLDGVVGCDMGAYEFSNYRMTFSGQPILGQGMNFTLTGLPGIGQICVALLDGQVYNNPYGMVLVGTPATALLEDLVHESYGYPIFIPNMPQFVGTEFGVQMGGAALGDTTTGNITNLYRGVIQD